MDRLTLDQRKVLAEFCANFAVAWLAAGLVAPLVVGKTLAEISKQGFLMSLGWGMFFVGSAAYLVKGGIR
jgi:hypothetical protein